MQRYNGCLGSLPEGQRRVLELRGGTGGPPRSRRDTATQLGISTHETAKREHQGLRGLRSACGGSGGGGAGFGSNRSASLLAASGAPAFQPAVMLAGTPALRKTADMRQGEQGVLGESASGGSSSSGGDGKTQYASIVPGTSLLPVAGDASSGALIWIPLLLLVALVTAGLIASRRRQQPVVVASSIAPAVVAPERSTAPSAAEPEPAPEPETAAEEEHEAAPAFLAAPFPTAEPEPEAAAVPEPEPEPTPEPVAAQPDWQWPSPSAPEHPDTAHRIAERAKRPATAAAAGLVGVLVRELLKRRRR